MITNTRQNWQPGQSVNIGFLKGFNVIGAKAVKDFMPDIYFLERKGSYYEFIPHKGLSKLSHAETIEWLKAGV